jgi:hypothetical protein
MDKLIIVSKREKSGSGKFYFYEPATATNTTLALRPFGKQPDFISEIVDHVPAVSPMRTVIGNCVV